ncbi:MAG: lysylphosphatidylglycerol synthase transmembrane domain-containing protein [Planctomycetota bacterium]
MTEGVEAERVNRKSWKGLVRWLKFVVFACVLAGLALAVQKAMRQWDQQIDAGNSVVAELDAQIVQARRESDRQALKDSNGISTRLADHARESEPLAELQQRRREALAAVPRLRNLNWTRIAWAALIYAVALLPPGLLLHQALHSLGQSCRRKTAVAAQVMGHAGKYVPGKAMVIVLRVGTLRGDGVAMLAGTTAVFLETLLMMAVGGTIAGILIIVLPVPSWIRWSALGIALAAGLPTLPPILQRVLHQVWRAKRSSREMQTSSEGSKPEEGKGDARDGSASTEPPGGVGANPAAPLDRMGGIATWKLFCAGWGYSALAWFAIMSSFFCLVTALPASMNESSPSTWELALVSGAAISLAMVVGFASLIPGGAGVRELVLTTVLGVSVGAAPALLAAIMVRLLFLAVECFAAAVAWGWLRASTMRHQVATKS